MSDLEKEIKKHSREGGRFIFINGVWWFVPSTYEINYKKTRLGYKLIDVPVSFKLKKPIKEALEKKRKESKNKD